MNLLIREECIKALDCLSDDDKMDELAQNFSMDDDYVSHANYEIARKWCYDQLKECIDEHFDNPPITVSDIPYEKELICWDNVEKEWCSIYSEGGEVSIAYFQLPTVYTMYETFDKKHGNRFYRKEVHE